VVDETAGGDTGVDVPQAQGAIPRSGQGELAIGGDDDVLNEVGVAVQGALGVAVLALLAGQLPHNDGVVTRSRQNSVRLLTGGGDGSHPAVVALQLTAQSHSLSHIE